MFAIFCSSLLNYILDYFQYLLQHLFEHEVCLVVSLIRGGFGIIFDVFENSTVDLLDFIHRENKSYHLSHAFLMCFGIGFGSILTPFCINFMSFGD